MSTLLILVLCLGFSMALVNIDLQGYYNNDGKRLVPVGVNYWPGSSGMHMWDEWPIKEIQHDLDVVVKLGFNTVRFFLVWSSFEPVAGEYDEIMFSRLSTFLSLCRERKLFVTVSVFVGWMSGGTFWPPWKDNRNLYSDPFVSTKSITFAKTVAETVKPFSDILLALEYGNELTALSDSGAASITEIYNWQVNVTSIWNSVIPGVLVISGTDMGTLTSDNGWQLGHLPVNVTSIHVYPVQYWNPVRFDGLKDPLVQSFMPFYVTVTKAFSPAMVQEFGTIVSGGIVQQDAYLRAALPESWKSGSNGYLWWCLRDIKSTKFPYNSNGLESMLGLVTDDDTVKPGLEYYIEFSKQVSQLPTPPLPTNPIGIYFPREYFGRGNYNNPGNNPSVVSGNMLISYYVLRQLGYNVTIIRGDLPLPSSVKTIIIPSAVVTLPEVSNFVGWVKNGGNLIWNGMIKASWSYETVNLIGAIQVDNRIAAPSFVPAFNSTFTFSEFLDGTKIEYSLTTATIIGYDYSIPICFWNKFGSGNVIVGVPAVEQGWAKSTIPLSNRVEWLSWYSNILKLVGNK